MGIMSEINAEICIDRKNIIEEDEKLKLVSDPNLVSDVKIVWGIDLENQNLLKHIKDRGLFIIKTNSKFEDFYSSARLETELDAKIDAEEKQELLNAKAGMAIAEAKLGDKSKYASIPDMEPY